MINMNYCYSFKILTSVRMIMLIAAKNVSTFQDPLVVSVSQASEWMVTSVNVS
jgi:hypothetical protein